MKPSDTLILSDPLFPLQWHLLNQGTTPGSIAGYDINVVSVWPDYTGRGVLVGVLDDGMDNTHPDLVDNYRPDLAWDVSLDIPGAAVQTSDDEHGVAVSGLVAATANNGIGGAGVAWGSQFTMYRMAFEADDVLPLLLSSFQKAVVRKVADGVQVSVNSWGPGFMLNDRATSDAFLAAGRYLAQEGREGLGIAAVFAAGNDREAKMNTNYDPTDKSPWHIVVAASNQAGGTTTFSTPGASILISAPGSDPDSMVT
ncbi:MAG: S8 family serine peptidase, partial [Burkholderiaceae bacterium]